MTEQSPSDRLNRASNDILDATSFLSGTNAAFIEGLYAQYLANPDSVDAGWRAYFAELGETGLRPPSWAAAPPGGATSKPALPQDELTQALSRRQPAAAKPGAAKSRRQAPARRRKRAAPRRWIPSAPSSWCAPIA